MKRIILSRKGFDSSTGKTPSRASPIFEDGSIFSIPVQINNTDPDAYGNVEYGGINAYEAIKYTYKNAKSGSPYNKEDRCHFDPNLSILPGVFGQQGSDQGELEKCGISEGDLFLFFGWFQTYGDDQTKINAHHLFGWLQVDKIIKGTIQIREYCHAMKIQHPHAKGDWKQNTLYVSSNDLKTDHGVLKGKGAGFFKTTDKQLILSRNLAERKSLWQFPEEYFRSIADSSSAYEMFVAHDSKSKGPNTWLDLKNLTVNTNRGHWQELAMDSEKFPSLEKWAFDLIRNLG